MNFDENCYGEIVKYRASERNCDWDFGAMRWGESWRRRWENTSAARGAARESLIVRVGASSPSNAPSRRVLQIDSAIVWNCCALPLLLLAL